MITKTAILYRRQFKIAKSWAKDMAVGLAFGVSIIATMYLIAHLPALYTWLTGVR